jgi:hypothetical protein
MATFNMHNINQNPLVFPNFFTFHNQKFKCSIILQASDFIYLFLMLLQAWMVFILQVCCVVEYDLAITLMMKKWWFKNISKYKLVKIEQR